MLCYLLSTRIIVNVMCNNIFATQVMFACSFGCVLVIMKVRAFIIVIDFEFTDG